MALESDIRYGTIIIDSKIIADRCADITGLLEVVNGVKNDILGIGTEILGTGKLVEEDGLEFNGAILFCEAKSIFQIKQDVTNAIMIQFHKNTSFPENHSILDGEKQQKTEKNGGTKPMWKTIREIIREEKRCIITSIVTATAMNVLLKWFLH